MVPENSILRKLPIAMDTAQRLRFEALIFSSDTLAYAFSQIRLIAESYGSKIASISLHDRIALFSHCWTFVNELHATRLILTSFFKEGPGPGPNQSAFLERAKIATVLRNKITHLNQNIGNLSQAKGPHAPIFGALSYFYVGDNDYNQIDSIPTAKRGKLVTLNSGSMYFKNTLISFPNPLLRDIHIPVSLFQFTAFGQILYIEVIVKELISVLGKLNSGLDQQIRRKVETISIEEGVSPDRIYTAYPSNFVIELDISFDEMDESGQYTSALEVE